MGPPDAGPLKGDGKLILLFYAMWIIFNGRITAEVCLVGLLVTAVLYLFMCRFTGYNIRRDARLLLHSAYIAGFAAILLVDILKSNLRMAAIILDRRIPVRQTVVCFDVDLKRPVTKVMLASAITLTPGTITISIDGPRFTVHCLDRAMIDGIQEGPSMRILRKMEA
jgi:multicomponent Na+:H+ antiporter subunit E